MPGYVPRVLRLVVEPGLSRFGRGTFQQHFGPRDRKKLAFEADWGKMVLICTDPNHHPLGVSLNIGTLFWASTEGSVAPRLKNKN